MKPTNLKWEDVIQFEEVKDTGKSIWKMRINIFSFRRGNCGFLVSSL